jgi:hypothetical protein
MELVRSKYPTERLVELESVCAAKRMDIVLTEGLPHRMTAGCKQKSKLEISNREKKGYLK